MDYPSHKSLYGRLTGYVAIVTETDTALGQLAALALANEGADLALVGDDAAMVERTEALVRAHGSRTYLSVGDTEDPSFCQSTVEETFRYFGKLDILICGTVESEEAAAQACSGARSLFVDPRLAQKMPIIRYAAAHGAAVAFAYPMEHGV